MIITSFNQQYSEVMLGYIIDRTIKIIDRAIGKCVLQNHLNDGYIKLSEIMLDKCMYDGSGNICTLNYEKNSFKYI